MSVALVHSVARPYVWKVPGNFLGARMYPIINKSAEEIAQMKEYVEDLDDPNMECAWLGFATTCQGTFNVGPSIGGNEPCYAGVTTPHGHFIHWGDSGTAILQAPISSQPFFDFALGKLPSLGNGFGFPEESVAIFAELLQEERARLLPSITDHEKSLMEGDAFIDLVHKRLVWIG